VITGHPKTSKIHGTNHPPDSHILDAFITSGFFKGWALKNERGGGPGFPSTSRSLGAALFVSILIVSVPALCQDPPMTTLLIATRNSHKVGEIRAILSDKFRFLTLSDFPAAPNVIEDAATFAGNATKKALELAHWLVASSAPRAGKSLPDFVLADDSGLEVDALNGAPGVHSARFAALDAESEGNSPDAANNAKLLRLLADVPPEKRTARFRCVIALTPIEPAHPQNTSPVCDANPFELQTELFDGTCEGRIIMTSSGKGGFGYDPLFVPDGFSQSFAELGESVKNEISHRACALAKLRERFQTMSRGDK
jgi:XTP/dITP diphosphohydrolase